MSRYRPECRALGVPLHAVQEGELLDLCAAGVAQGDTECASLFAYMNLHGVYVYHRNEYLRKATELADVVYIDGMPLVWAARAAGYRVRSKHRVTSIDFLDRLLARAAEGRWRIFFLGGTEESCVKACGLFREKHPGLEIGWHNGYFKIQPDHAENQEVLRQIEAFQPDLLFVGMGMPRQEQWVVENLPQVRAKVVWCIGAMMDYFAGIVPTPPRFLGRLGLEWLYRLLSEPKRLWYRYLVEPLYLIPLFLKDIGGRLFGRRRGGDR